MRKTNNFFDNFLWYFIYILPLFFVFFFAIVNNVDFLTTLYNFLSGSIAFNNIIFTTLSDLFGSSSSVFPILTDTFLFYFSYLVSVWTIHIAVDILLFIPKILHNLLDKGVRNEK